ncbi:MAG: transporter [Coxiella sp. DG_40]|nr:MAG: transporter [Coxiella sp. DG_40]
MPNKVQHSGQKVLGVFTLAMINVAAIASLKNFPVMAEVGIALVFFYFVAAIVFFIPTALVSAELATGWPSTGGIYTWVKQGLGGRWGFVAIWLQWIENVIWYPAMLAFVAATVSYLFAPELAGNKYFILMTILVVYWTCTAINFLGMEASGFISSVGAIVGTIIPSIIIILLTIMWIMSGKPIHISFNLHAFIPQMRHIDDFVFLVGVLLALCGMEMSAVHANEVKNPQYDYPRAIFLSTVIILVLSILGSLAIAAVVPRVQISLVAGVMQAFSAFFEADHAIWLTPILAIMIAIGAVAMVSTWIVGPSKGLLQTARDGDIPPFFQHINKNNMPVTIMLVQGLFVTILAFAFLLMPTVSSSYWILSVLTAQLYLLMYLLMFITGIRLRYLQKHIKRAYSIPGGKYVGMWIVAGCGSLAAFSGFILGFFPPSQLPTGNIWFYEGFLGLGTIIMLLLPLLIYSQRRKSWQLK